jgi:protein SCO1/2
MTRPLKILAISAWLLAALAGVSLLALAKWRRTTNNTSSAQSESLPKLFHISDFQLVNQNNHPFTAKDLAGKVWIADFVFTQCMGPCPAMTSAMADMQKELAGSGIHLVSVSVDPANDTPQVLKSYMKNMAADESTWTFATGKPDDIFGLAAQMKIAASADAQNSIIHSEKFVLVDRDGWIRGYYFFQDADKRAQLLRDARQLAAGS